MNLIANRFLAVHAALTLAIAGGAAAGTISNVQVLTSSFGLHNQYDSINGLSQVTTNGINVSGAATASVGPINASVGLNSQSFDANNNRTSFSSASAYANLAAGTIGVSAAGSLSVNTASCCSLASAQAALQDTLTFSNTTGHVVDIDVFWTFDGSVTSNATSRNDFGSYFCFEAAPSCQVQGAIGGGGIVQPLSNARFNYQYSVVGFGGLSVTTPGSGFVSSSYTSTPLSPGQTLSTGLTDVVVTFHGIYGLAAGTSVENVYGNLTAFCGGGVIASQGCDYSHTGALSFNLADPGVSFTSASGVLLTQQAPEPVTGLLLICGLAAAVAARQRAV